MERDRQSMGNSRSLVANGGVYSATFRTPMTGEPGSIVTGTGADWFGPLQPMSPIAPPDVKGRILDFPTGYNLNVRPRAYETVTFGTLRNFADSYDLLRILIETRKDQMSRLQWNIVPRDKKMNRRGATVPADIETRINDISEFFLRPDKENFWGDWLRLLLEDLFVIDAPTIYRRRTFGGDLYALQPLDGGTIKRVIDDWGHTPMPPAPAYQQVLKGYPAIDYTSEEIIYRPRVRRTHKVYGYSPVEQILMTINIGLRRQTWQLESFTEGNIPEALIGTPATWTPDQVRQFQDWFDSMLQGNTGERRRARFVPGDVAKGYIPTKPSELFGGAEEWLVRVMCYCFNVSPQPFVNMMNRATAETAQETAVSEGLAPIQNWVKGLMDLVLIDDFDSPDLEFKWLEEDELDPDKKSQIIDREQAAGRLTYNEARREQGLDVINHPDADRPMFKTASGWVPIFLTPEEQAAKDEAAQALKDSMAAKGPPGGADAPEGGQGDEEPDAGSVAPPEGGEVAEKSDLPFAPHQHGPGCGCELAKAGKASNTSIPLNPLRPSVSKIEARLTRKLKADLKVMGVAVSKKVQAKLSEVAKAEYPDDYDVDALLDEINLEALMFGAEDLIEAMSEVADEAGRLALSQVGQEYSTDDIFERVNDRALTWVDEHAAELVSVDGDMSLVASTRRMIRETISQGLSDNLSMADIGGLLEEGFAFSEERARLIAATEITSANSMGALSGYQEAEEEGVKLKKSWLVLEDGCSICDANAAQGPIPLEDDFSSGDKAPGAHPNCRCVLVPEVEDE